MRSLWAFLGQLQFLDLLGFMKIMGWYTCHLFLQSLFSCNHCFFSARALIESPFLLRVQPHFIKNENDVLHLFFYVHCNVPDDLPNRRTFHDFEPQKSMAHIFNKSAMWGMWPVGTGDVNENPGLKLRKERWNLNWRSWASHHVFWQITHWASGKKQWIFPCCFTLPVVSLDRLIIGSQGATPYMDIHDHIWTPGGLFGPQRAAGDLLQGRQLRRRWRRTGSDFSHAYKRM